MKIVILLNNDFDYDSRVKRHVESLKKNKNYKVFLLCLKGKNKKFSEKKSNFIIKRFDLNSVLIFKIINIPKKIINLLKNKLKKLINTTYYFHHFHRFLFHFLMAIINFIHILFLPLTALVNLIFRFEKKIVKNYLVKGSINFKYIKSFFNNKIFTFTSFIFTSLLDLSFYISRTFFWYFETDVYKTLFFSQLTKINPDIIIANDLSTLKCGATYVQKFDSFLIYDSHELEIDRNMPYPKFVINKRRSDEKKYINYATHVLTVSESYAKFLARFYKIKRPTVIYNSPSFKKIKFINKYENSNRKLKKIIYIGLVTFNRGIENLIQSLKYFDNINLVFLGPVNVKFKKEVLDTKFYSRIIKQYKIQFDMVNSKDVVSYVRNFDVSVIPIQNSSLSYKYCFPNKLLESIFSNIPCAVSNLPELRKFVTTFNCGIVFNENDPKDIYNKISYLLKFKNRFLINEDIFNDIKKQYSYEIQEKKIISLINQCKKLNDKNY